MNATKTKPHYLPLADRPAAPDMTLPQLVAEFASLRVDSATQPDLTARHRRLSSVVTELRRRGALDDH